LLVMANVVLSSSILVTLMMEALRSSETSVIARTTRRNIPGDSILYVSHVQPLLVRVDFCMVQMSAVAPY
jgi:hypothetical protein